MNVVEELAALSDEGLAACERRGHLMEFVMNVGQGGPGLGRRYQCVRCPGEFDAYTHPAPNSADLIGNALALNCPIQKEDV